MKKRIITGLVIFLALAGVIALRWVHTLFFDAFVLVIMLASVNEMISAYKLNDRKCYKLLAFAFPVLLWLCYFFGKQDGLTIVFQFITLLVFFCICFTIELLSTHKKGMLVEKEVSSQDLIDNKNLIAETLTTLKICFYPTILLGTLYGINNFGLYDGLAGLLLVFGITTFSDMFAYFFGVTFGQKKDRIKLCPHISPKKSLIGFVFGCIGGIIASGLGLLFFYFFPIFDSYLTTLPVELAILFFFAVGMLGTLVSQFGDLLSSAFKRKIGIKDFGSIFPGHGGFMDRVDSLMFTSTLIYLCFLCIFSI